MGLNEVGVQGVKSWLGARALHQARFTSLLLRRHCPLVSKYAQAQLFSLIEISSY